MAITLGFDLIKTLFIDTSIFNVSWIISLGLTFFTLMLLTKDTSKWKELAFPVMVGWHIAGIPPFILFYIIGALLFVIDTLSLQTIANILSVIKKPKDKLNINQEIVRSKKKKIRTLIKTPTKAGRPIGSTVSLSPSQIKDYIERTRGNR